MYTVAVCEDQKDTREEAAALCSEVLTDLDIEHRIAVFSSAEELETQLLSGERFDLLCLDILMDGKSGMELAKKLRMTDDRTSILFLTGSSEYLKDGYEVRPIQYLLKPVKREELARAIETDLRLHHQSKTVSIHVGGRTFVLPIADILYAESREHGTVLHTIHGEQFLPCSLSQTEESLPAENFCRCHNSFLVNFSHIREVSGRTVYLLEGGEVSIGRLYGAVPKSIRPLSQPHLIYIQKTPRCSVRSGSTAEHFFGLEERLSQYGHAFSRSAVITVKRFLS